MFGELNDAVGVVCIVFILAWIVSDRVLDLVQICRVLPHRLRDFAHRLVVLKY